MSLEDAIRQHAVAIEKLVDAINRGDAGGSAKPAATVKTDTPKPAPAATPKAAPAAPTAAPAKAATPAPAAAPNPEAELEKLRAEGKTLILKVIAKKGRETGLKLLNGAANVSGVPADKLADFVKECKELLA